MTIEKRLKASGFNLAKNNVYYKGNVNVSRRWNSWNLTNSTTYTGSTEPIMKPVAVYTDAELVEWLDKYHPATK